MAELDDMQDRIEAYVLDEMDADAAKAFAADIAADTELAAQVADFRALGEDLALLDEADFLADMRRVGEELREVPANPEARPFRRRWFIAVAAAVLLLLIPTVLLLGPSSEGSLFETYFEAYPDVSSSRAETDADFVSAMEDYNAGEYVAALPHFSDYLQDHPDNETGLFYSGIAESVAGDPVLAADRLEKLVGGESIYGTAAKWYRALALVKAGQEEAAVPLLEGLAGGAGDYREKAAALLAELGGE